MNDEPDSIDRRLQRALHELRDADADLGAAPEVAARLRSAVGQRRRERRRQMAWLSAAAAIVLSASVARWYFTLTSMADQPVRVEALAPDPGPSSEVPTDFLPLRYASVPASSGRIVQLVVPSSAMASFGLDPASAGGDAVNADVFVGDDGLARAIRFSPFSAKELVP